MDHDNYLELSSRNVETLTLLQNFQRSEPHQEPKIVPHGSEGMKCHCGRKWFARSVYQRLVNVAQETKRARSRPRDARAAKIRCKSQVLVGA